MCLCVFSLYTYASYASLRKKFHDEKIEAVQPPLMNPVLVKPALRSPAAAKLSGFFDEKFGAYAYVPICDPPLENLELEVVKNTPGDT